MPLPSSRLRLGLLALAFAAGAPAAMVASSPAGASAVGAAPVTIVEEDDRNDTELGGTAAVDIVAATVSQDRATGVFSAKVTFRGDPALEPTAWLDVVLAFQYGTRSYCYTDDLIAGIAHLTTQIGAPDARWYVNAPTDNGGPATKVVEGNTITLTSAPSPLLKSSAYSCVGVQTFASDVDDKLARTMSYDWLGAAVPKDVPVATPTPPPASVDGKPQLAPDRDQDAVPDSTDKCIDVPGAGTDGCPTTPPAKSLKLGTKRLVVDRLLQRTGSACPTVVKATVVAKGRTLGKTKLGVIAKGSWCHATGVVKLKKRVKKVRVVIAGKGVASVKQVVAKG